MILARPDRTRLSRVEFVVNVLVEYRVDSLDIG